MYITYITSYNKCYFMRFFKVEFISKSAKLPLLIEQYVYFMDSMKIVEMYGSDHSNHRPYMGSRGFWLS